MGERGFGESLASEAYPDSFGDFVSFVLSGLSEHMYKYCTRQTRTYIGMPKKHILRESRNGFGGVGECLDDVGAEA